MSETKQNTKPGCCKDCAERRPGCHDVNVCMAWAAEVAMRKQRQKERMENVAIRRVPWERRRLI